MPAFRFSLGAILLLLLCYFGGRHGAIAARVPAPATFFNPFRGFWQQAETIHTNQTSHHFSNTGYSGQIIYDERKVPHIFAHDRDAAAFMLGYTHARHRRWQMDISTRATAGRLAEVFGADLLERDKQQKRKGLVQAAENALKAWQQHPPTMALVAAYCAGVNMYTESLSPADYPLEYKLLGHKPESWTPLHSALFLKSMAESLCFRHHDLERSTTLSLLGDSLFQAIYPEHNPAQSPIIAAETSWDFTPLSFTDTAESLSWLSPYPSLPQAPEGIGSNNWALSGEKTATGYPLLANDPHLQLTLPSIWYEVQLHTPEANSYGVSLPSLPGILIGFNERSAWGITNVGQDVLDWYRIHWTDTSQTHYWLDDVATPVEWITDTIQVRDSEPVVIQTPWTVFGPVVYDGQGGSSFSDLAMRWVSHDIPFKPSHNSVEVFQELIANRSVAEYRTAISGFDNPGSNIVYANQDGDIALTVTGRFPLRRPQQGRFVQDGKRKDALWADFIPFSHVPYTVNPEQGFVASANQRSTAGDYPYYYFGYFDDFRGRYINRQLDSIQAATVADMEALQLDSYSLTAEELTPSLLQSLESIPLDAKEKHARQVLHNWDYRFTAASEGAVIFQHLLDTLYQLTFDEVWQYRQEGRSLLAPEKWRLIDLVRNHPQHPILDRLETPVRENADSLLRQAFRIAVNAVEAPTWNELRATRIRHLGRVPGLGSDILYTDGARDTPNALSSTHGPSWRMIVSLERPVKAWGVLPGGASGNPGSPYYTTSLPAWTRGDYFELPLWSSPEDEQIVWREKVVFD